MSENSRRSELTLSELKQRLLEAEENLAAISSGKADAIVVQNENGLKVFTIQGAETAYRIMVENMNEGALTIDSNGVVLYTNDRFCTMIDWPCSYITGKLFQDFISTECKDSFDLLLKKTVTGAKVHQDFELSRKDGTSIFVYLSCAPLEISNRHDICIVVSDLTERMAARQKLIRLNNELEMKVADRTKELERQKKELEKSREDLFKLAQSLEDQVNHRTAQVRDLAKALSLAEQKERQRLSDILHENLQQVLFSIKTRFDLLSNEFTDFPEEMKQDIEDLKMLIIKALDTSKMLAIEFNPPVLKNEGLDAALKWLAHHIESRYHLKVHVNITGEFRIIPNEERVLLVQFVRELLFNVVRHAKTGSASVSVKGSGTYIIITVEDRGVGFRVEEQKKWMNEKNKLGIFSIEERLRLLGGRLRIESSPGYGSKFTIYLPYEERNKQLGVT